MSTPCERDSGGSWVGCRLGGMGGHGGSAEKRTVLARALTLVPAFFHVRLPLTCNTRPCLTPSPPTTALQGAARGGRGAGRDWHRGVPGAAAGAPAGPLPGGGAHLPAGAAAHRALCGGGSGAAGGGGGGRECSRCGQSGRRLGCCVGGTQEHDLHGCLPCLCLILAGSTAWVPTHRERHATHGPAPAGHAAAARLLRPRLLQSRDTSRWTPPLPPPPPRRCPSCEPRCWMSKRQSSSGGLSVHIHSYLRSMCTCNSPPPFVAAFLSLLLVCHASAACPAAGSKAGCLLGNPQQATTAAGFPRACPCGKAGSAQTRAFRNCSELFI